MDYIRLVNPQHCFDWRRKRLNRNAFGLGGDGGVSIIECACIKAGKWKTECRHARKLYPARTGGRPVVFYFFTETALPPGHSIEADDPPLKDVCHRNILGLSEDQLDDFVNSIDPMQLFICRQDGAHAPVTADDIKAFEALAKEVEERSTPAAGT